VGGSYPEGWSTGSSPAAAALKAETQADGLGAHEPWVWARLTIRSGRVLVADAGLSHEAVGSNPTVPRRSSARPAATYQGERTVDEAEKALLAEVAAAQKRMRERCAEPIDQWADRLAKTFCADLDHDQIGRDLRDFGVTFSVDGKTIPMKDVLAD
jgi:hypothetical protein